MGVRSAVLSSNEFANFSPFNRFESVTNLQVVMEAAPLAQVSKIFAMSV